MFGFCKVGDMSEGNGVRFSVFDGRFCVCRLPAGADIPAFPTGARIYSVTRTPEEISIICDEAFAPTIGEIERTWRVLMVEGPLEFALKGILVSLLNPLNDAKVSVFALSTYNTDYILVQEHVLERAVGALEGAGHERFFGNDGR